MKDILNRFCSKDGFRPSISEPWSRGTYSYATNGHVICRVPRQEDISERDDAPGAVDKMFDIPAPAEWFPLADMKIPKEKMVECSECEDGKIQHEECQDCDGHTCENCNGTGKVSQAMTPVAVGNTHFQGVYLRILKDLPDCKLGPHADLMGCAVFMFDGGDGLLMPMKAFEGRE